MGNNRKRHRLRLWRVTGVVIGWVMARSHRLDLVYIHTGL